MHSCCAGLCQVHSGQWKCWAVGYVHFTGIWCSFVLLMGCTSLHPPPGVYDGTRCSTHSSTIHKVSNLLLANLMGMTLLIIVLICIFLIPSQIEHLVIYLLVIHVLSINYELNCILLFILLCTFLKNGQNVRERKLPSCQRYHRTTLHPRVLSCIVSAHRLSLHVL